MGLFRRTSPGFARPLDLGRIERALSPPPIQIAQPRQVRKKRRFARRDAWAICKITLKHGHEREGVIIDISEGGARIRFRTRSNLSPTIRIQSSRHQLDKVAVTIWQNKFDAGIEFVDADPTSL